MKWRVYYNDDGGGCVLCHTRNELDDVKNEAAVWGYGIRVEALAALGDAG